MVVSCWRRAREMEDLTLDLEPGVILLRCKSVFQFNGGYFDVEAACEPNVLFFKHGYGGMVA